MKYIESTEYGFEVRFQSLSKFYGRKYFGIREYGALDKALAAAKSFRDHYFKTVWSLRGVRPRACRKGSVKGVSGVAFLSRKGSNYYVASWREDDGLGGRRTWKKYFSFNPECDIDTKHAFTLAKKWREKMVKQHYRDSKAVA